MNTEQNEEQVLEVESTQPGRVLKDAREALGLSDQDVADRLRLRVSVIRELEENCCDNKQIATFTRGYIRSYAKLVGLNADDLLRGFQAAPQSEESAQKMQSFSRQTRIDKHDSRVMSLTWVILAVVVGITTFWWWQNQQNDPLMSLSDDFVAFTQSDSTSEANEQITETEITLIAPSQTDTIDASDSELVEPEISAQGDASATDNNTTNNITASDSVDTQPEVETTPAVDPATPVVTASNTVSNNADVANQTPSLVLSFKGDCWVDIRDASGKRLLTGIKSAGETVDLSGQAPFKVVLGAPAAVNLVYNGNKVDLSSYPSGRVARLSLPK
ncbi:cytoskeleton protein RodZ [Enterovibrio sp. 27052020O]|uniref:cytoskeleton protein RodZ n=1 Tax=Enterovibrio sp. 27052020O TaxID=3241166 RepID=UPI00388CF8AC